MASIGYDALREVKLAEKRLKMANKRAMEKELHQEQNQRKKRARESVM